MRDQAVFLGRLSNMEAALVRAGLKPMPEWWQRQIERFYRSGKRRWVVRKGRRVFASTCIAPRLAVAEAIFGEHPHVAGSPPVVFAFVSVRRDEAADRLTGIRAILDRLGEPYQQRGDTIELTKRPAAFAVLTASHRTAVGGTIGFAWCDEVSRWRDDATSSNPAEEIVGSLSPALATLPDARLCLVSSPLGNEDFHARSFDRGDTPEQSVSFGATWEINPSLTEDMCRRLEPDARLFAREYGARPQAGVLDCFDADAIDRAFAITVDRVQAPVLVLDPSSGKADSFTYAIVGWASASTPTGRALSFQRIGAVEGRFWDRITGTEIVDRLAAVARAHGIRDVHTDQRESLMLSAALRERGFVYHEHTWTSPAKVAAVTHLRRLLAIGEIALEPHDKLRRELLAFEERLTSGGQFTYAARRSGHDDFVALLITAAMADIRRMLPDAPHNPRIDWSFGDMVNAALRRVFAVSSADALPAMMFGAGDNPDSLGPDELRGSMDGPGWETHGSPSRAEPRLDVTAIGGLGSGNAFSGNHLPTLPPRGSK